MSTGDRWRLGHRPALDGLRGIAVLLVVVSHALPDQFGEAGAVGVTVFFALSGFLITALLLEEHAATGRIGLGAFYLRRARRLLPALLVFLGVATLLGVLVAPAFARSTVLLPVVFYVGNWVPALGAGSLGGLTHTWSLAVEEQFYIAYPLLLVGMMGRASRRVLMVALGAGVVVSLGLRVALWVGGAGADRVYFGTDTNAAPLLAGCVLAMFLHGRRVGRARPAVASALLAALGLLGLTGDGATARVVVPMVTAVAAVAVLYCLTAGPCSGWLSARWLTLVGRRSYGLYLWHFPIFAIVFPVLTGAGASRLVSAPLLAACAWGVTSLSWRYVEQPVQRRGAARAPEPGGRTDPARVGADVQSVPQPVS